MENLNFNCEERVRQLEEMIKEKDQQIMKLKDEMRIKEVQCHRLAHEGSDF